MVFAKMQVLASTQQPTADTGLRVAALSSLRTYLQATAAGAGERADQHRWALACVGCIAPPAAAHAHGLLGPDATRQLKQADVQVSSPAQRWLVSPRDALPAEAVIGTFSSSSGGPLIIALSLLWPRTAHTFVQPQGSMLYLPTRGRQMFAIAVHVSPCR